MAHPLNLVPPSDELTDKEITILTMAADGDSLTQICIELDRSYETVKHCVAILKRKLGAKNLTHAVALAYHKGVLIPKEIK